MKLKFNQSGSTITVAPSAAANTVTKGAFGAEGTKRANVRVYNQTNAVAFVRFGLGTDADPNTATMLQGMPIAAGDSISLTKAEGQDTMYIMTEVATPTGKVYGTPGFAC